MQDDSPRPRTLSQVKPPSNQWPCQENAQFPTAAAAGETFGRGVTPYNPPAAETLDAPVAPADVVASQASSRGPLKLSMRRIQQDATAEKENTGSRVPGAWPGRGFLQTLQSSLPREFARIAGVRQPGLLTMAEEGAGGVPAKRDSEAAAVAAGVAAAEAAMAPAPQPLVRGGAAQPRQALQDTFATKQQTGTASPSRFSFFHYFVGRPSMPPNDSAAQGFATPPLKPRGDVPAVAGPPSHPVTLSPPYYTPSLTMSDPPLCPSQPGRAFNDKHNTVSPPTRGLMSQLSIPPTFASHLDPQPKVPSAPRESSWQHPSTLDCRPSGICAYPSMLRQATAPTIALSPRQRAATEAVQRSREALHAAQHATPEQARAILERLASVQRGNQVSK